MKNRILNIFTLFILTLFLSACSQKITIEAIKAGQVSDRSIKNIAVSPFSNDNVGQAEQIDSQLSNVQINNNKYFNVIDRKNLKKILDEKKLNDSGLVDLVSNSVNTGLKEIETLVTGTVITSNMSTTYFTEIRTDFTRCVRYIKTKDGKTVCDRFRTYDVSCKANTYNVQTKIKLTKIADASTIFSKTYGASDKISHCEDEYNIIPSKREVNTKLAGTIAKNLVLDIAPSYRYFEVEVLDDLDIDLTKSQEKKFENALKMMELKRNQKANELLKELNIQTSQRSYIILYNYGLSLEALGNPKEALEIYKKAEDISLSTEGVVKEISHALIRTKINIKEINKYNKQK